MPCAARHAPPAVTMTAMAAASAPPQACSTRRAQPARTQQASGVRQAPRRAAAAGARRATLGGRHHGVFAHSSCFRSVCRSFVPPSASECRNSASCHACHAAEAHAQAWSSRSALGSASAFWANLQFDGGHGANRKMGGGERRGGRKAAAADAGVQCASVRGRRCTESHNCGAEGHKRL